MRRVPFMPEQLNPEARGKWEALQQDADEAVAKMFERYHNNQKPDPDRGQAIWAEIKRFLLNNMFERKCAYCEANTDASAPQHAEHWRPKNAVTDPRTGKK